MSIETKFSCIPYMYGRYPPSIWNALSFFDPRIQLVRKHARVTTFVRLSLVSVFAMRSEIRLNTPLFLSILPVLYDGLPLKFKHQCSISYITTLGLCWSASAFHFLHPYFLEDILDGIGRPFWEYFPLSVLFPASTILNTSFFVQFMYAISNYA